MEVAGAGLSLELAREVPPRMGAPAALRFLGLGVVALFSRPDAKAGLATWNCRGRIRPLRAV